MLILFRLAPLILSICTRDILSNAKDLDRPRWGLLHFRGAAPHRFSCKARAAAYSLGARNRVLMRAFDDAKNDEKDAAIELLTIQEVAKLLKVSVSLVRRLQQGRHLPFFKVGGSVRFEKGDIINYLKKQRVDSISRF
jgi:excisionase family DNA binding protein